VLRYALGQNLFEGERERLIRSLVPHAAELAGEKNGSRLLRALLEEAQTRAEVAELEAALISHTASLACSEAGVLVVSTLLAYPHATQQTHTALIAALRPRALELASDSHAYHVLQSCLLLTNKSKLLSESELSCSVREEQYRLADALIVQSESLATDTFGSCVLQAALFYPVPARATALERLVDRSDELARCVYGNHVLQHVIAHASSEQRHRACSLLATHAVELASNTHASFALQGALRASTRAESEPLYNVLVAAAATLATHRISSIVLQQLLRCTPVDERVALIDAHMLPHVADLLCSDSAIFVLTDCAAVSPAMVEAIRVQQRQLERTIDEFAASAESTLVFPGRMSAYLRKRAHVFVRRRYGRGLLTMSIGKTDELRVLHIFKSDGAHARLPENAPHADATSLQLDGRFAPISNGARRSNGLALIVDGETLDEMRSEVVAQDASRQGSMQNSLSELLNRIYNNSARV